MNRKVAFRNGRPAAASLNRRMRQEEKEEGSETEGENEKKSVL